MSFSYSGNPEHSAKDEVRFLIGDTNAREPLLQDGEITYLLNKFNNATLRASMQACETISAKFSRMCNESVGSVSMSYSQKATAYITLRDNLRQRMITEDCAPWAGGISTADKGARESDEDRVAPAFTRDMMTDHQMDDSPVQGDQ